MIIEKKKDLQKETALRVKRMNEEFARKPEMKVFENVKKYDQLIAQIGIPLTGKCEHHELEFSGDVSIGYLPGKYLVGLSKVVRVAEFYMNPTRPTLQEEITQSIVDHLVNELHPKAVMVIVRATHGCIKDRGVKKKCLTITSQVYGLFKTDLGLRSEFLSLVNNN
jgi:GTP cyclohydrolase I